MEKENNFRHLVRIANTDLDGNKPFYHALTKVKGIGFNFANAITISSKIDKNKKIGDFSNEEIELLNDIISDPSKYKIPSWLYNRKKDVETGEDKHLLSSDLNFVQENDIKIMKKIKCYKGVRHYLRLPVRGQKTKSNFRRNKGKVTGVKKKKDKA